MISAMHQHPRRRFSASEAIRAVRAVQNTEKRNFPTVSVVFTTSTFIRRINRKFLRHDYATDVITFTLEAKGSEAELYINLDLAKTQAESYKVSYTAEVRRLIVHGMLHLCGYKDQTSDQKSAMRRRENTYLKRLESTKR
jgi:rRNA maturation RNase YbeY